MPLWLLRLWPHTLLGLTLITAFWWIDHRGYARAMVDRDARDITMLAKMQVALRDSEARLAETIADIDAQHDRQRSALADQRAALQPHIAREIEHEARLADPALGLTPGLLAAINQARATGACAATPTGRLVCALPAPAPGD